MQFLRLCGTATRGTAISTGIFHAEAFKRLDDFTWEENELHPCSITLGHRYVKLVCLSEKGFGQNSKIRADNCRSCGI